GILGNPVDHSLSPRMHNAAYAALGLDYVYVPFRTAPDGIRGAVRAMRTLGIVGFNVTVPYKQDVVRLVDRVTATASAIGAVNTIYRGGEDGNEIIGENTDAEGFAAALRSHGEKTKGARALVIGAGGSARAVLHALKAGGAKEVLLANRTVSKAARLAKEFGAAAVPLAALEDKAMLATRTLVVNCTPVGLKGGAYLRYDAAATPRDCVHFDLAYGRGLTPFLDLARIARRPLVDGRHMLVHQGAAAFRLFTNKKAPVDAMRKAVGLP